MNIPDKPEGWTRKMTLHLNFGEDGGRGEYTIMDDTGKVMPFMWFYDTRKGQKPNGFVHPECPDVMNWGQLRKFMEDRDG